uniref:Uncharacterized protein n=1 Tax=Panagrolaimus davidi TaxID=227884 RepID=A0A914QMK7_9BILA
MASYGNTTVQVRFSDRYRHQRWPFRDTIMDYITQNPSTETVYKKLTQTCKYFYSKNPVTVCAELIHDDECDSDDLWLGQNNKDLKQKKI